MTSIEQELPEHVRRIIDRDGAMQFTPPSFERWLGRLQMLRTISAMMAFVVVWLLSVDNGIVWETATVRGIGAAVAFYFFAWACGLFIFGELYDGEVKRARLELEARERDRAERIEAYYRERLRAQAAGTEPELPGITGDHDAAPLSSLTPPAAGAADVTTPMRRAAA